MWMWWCGCAKAPTPRTEPQGSASVEAFALIDAPEISLRQIAGIGREAPVRRIVGGAHIAPGAVAALDPDRKARADPGDHSGIVRGAGAKPDLAARRREHVAGAAAGQRGLVDPTLGAVDVADFPPDVE